MAPLRAVHSQRCKGGAAAPDETWWEAESEFRAEAQGEEAQPVSRALDGPIHDLLVATSV